ncbi:MAG: carboxypeptidase-like regulatory domain-containing protein [Nonlabens sp.]
MKILFWISLSLLGFTSGVSQDISILNSATRAPVPFATVAFGNGLGTFANEEGVFRFSRKLYRDVDTLTFSSLGYNDKIVAVSNLKDSVLLIQAENLLETIVVSAPLRGDFKIKELKPRTHNDYENCWLPTVQSEIAVKLNRVEGKPTQVTGLQLPILLENNAGRKKGSIRKFSTMFRLQFYAVTAADLPEKTSSYPAKTFIINQNSKEIFELDIEELNIAIPKSGLFAAIQVLGYTTPEGKLINAKKYREIKTRTGYTKISNTYRPLLPFTDELPAVQTYVRRIFLNDQAWQVFDSSYNKRSKLITTGHKNYGMGARLRVFERE